MADFIVLAIIFCTAIFGYKKGLVHSVFNFGYHIVSLIAAALFYPMVTDWLAKTSLYGKILDIVTQKLGTGGVDLSALPIFMQNTVKAGTDAVTNATAAMVTQLVLTVIAIVIVFVVVKVLLWVVSLFATSVTKLPIIKGINKLGGFFFGILSGFVVTYFALAILSMFPGSVLYEQVQISTIAKSMFDNNLIMNLFF